MEEDSAKAERSVMCGHVVFRLAELPKFAGREFHPRQVALYSRFTELTFKALNLPCVSEFMEELAGNLGLRSVRVRVLRMPARIGRVELTQSEDRTHLIVEYRHGLFRVGSGLIDVYPPIFVSSSSTTIRHDGIVLPIDSPARRIVDFEG